MCRCRGDGDGAAAACVLRSSVVAERARRGGRVCVATTARRVCCVRLATAALRSSSGVAERARRGGRVPAIRRSATYLNELLEGLYYYGVDVRHSAALSGRCGVAVAICVAAATAPPAELRRRAYSDSMYSNCSLLKQR